MGATIARRKSGWKRRQRNTGRLPARSTPGNAASQDAYQEMQKNYVFSLKDVLLFDYVLKQWRQLKAVLMEME
jgi:uridine phosphorylase